MMERTDMAATGPRQWIGWSLAIAVLAAVALAIGWVGYIASDDAAYYDGAARWLTAPPFAGADHWTTRFPVVLALAGSLLLFGRQLPAFEVAALLWYLALVLLIWRQVATIAGFRAGAIAALLTATMPVVVSSASTVGCDLPEAVFLLAGAALLGGAAGRPGRAVAAGLCFGLAMLCRETAGLALVGLGPLFLIGRPIERRSLMLAGVGIVLVLAGEALFQAIVAGDPFRRYVLAFNHDDHMSRAANMEGNWLVHPAIDPLLVLLVNNDFALLFWMGIVAVASRFWRGRETQALWRLAVPAALAIAMAVLVGAFVTKLVLNPRYFTVTAVVMAMVVAIWLDGIGPRWRALWLLAAVGSNLLMLGVQNGHPRWPAEALVLAARAYPQTTISADAETRHRAALPLQFQRSDRVRATGGALWLTTAEAADPRRPLVARYPSPPTAAGAVVRALGLEQRVPAAVAGRLFRPNPDMELRGRL